ncbi:MAG: hypothetical protein EON89_01265 [Brevundimonas sp.]|nr:MAG: hypothetical protein EON89_01265 [Brevundimonas sp.]
MPFSCIIESDIAGVLQMIEIAGSDPAVATEAAKKALKAHVDGLAAHVFANGEEVAVIGAADRAP